MPNIRVKMTRWPDNTWIEITEYADNRRIGVWESRCKTEALAICAALVEMQRGLDKPSKV
jgi:hypothetical protein